MSIFEYQGTTIHYEDIGEGYPILLLAPGGMRSAGNFWDKVYWNPVTILADSFRLIVMDQRNAGFSRAPVMAKDGWHSYTNDQLALLDHLDINRCHLLGMCIGGAYNLALLQAAPERFTSAVMMQPIGLTDNREAYYAMFDDWRDEIAAAHPEADSQTWDAFRSNMYGGSLEFFTTTDEFVQNCSSPLLVLLGNDLYHPESTSRRMAELAPNAALIEDWKEGAAKEQAIVDVRTFLATHQPGA